MSYGNKLREIRKKKGYTLEDISQMTGFTKSFISQIENGKNSPSIVSLKKICVALGTSIGKLFEDEVKPVHIIRHEDYEVVQDTGVHLTFMSSQFADMKIEPVVLEIEPYGESHSDDFKQLGERFGYVIEGDVSIIVGKDEYLLKQGESVYFTSGTPHKLKNHSNYHAKTLWIGTHSS